MSTNNDKNLKKLKKDTILTTNKKTMKNLENDKQNTNVLNENIDNTNTEINTDNKDTQETNLNTIDNTTTVIDTENLNTQENNEYFISLIPENVEIKEELQDDNIKDTEIIEEIKEIIEEKKDKEDEYNKYIEFDNKTLKEFLKEFKEDSVSYMKIKNELNRRSKLQ